MSVKSASNNRIRLESDKHEAAISLNWNNESKKWLLTAYEKETPPNSKTTNTTIAKKSGEGDTALFPDDVSDNKDTNNPQTNQNNPTPDQKSSNPKNPDNHGQNSKTLISDNLIPNFTTYNNPAWAKSIFNDIKSGETDFQEQTEYIQELRSKNADMFGEDSEQVKKWDSRAEDLKKMQGEQKKFRTALTSENLTSNPQLSPETNPDLQETDNKGIPFVKASNGTTVFGEINNEQAKVMGTNVSAPIKLSEGNSQYGEEHIHHRITQLNQNGYESVSSFVEDVANNYDEIREGNIYIDDNGKEKETFLLIKKGDKGNVLYIELSPDNGSYNVNSGGVFRNSYINKRGLLWNASTEHSTPSAVTQDFPAAQLNAESDAVSALSQNNPLSTSKDTKKVGTTQAKSEENDEQQEEDSHLPFQKSSNPDNQGQNQGNQGKKSPTSRLKRTARRAFIKIVKRLNQFGLAKSFIIEQQPMAKVLKENGYNDIHFQQIAELSRVNNQFNKELDAFKAKKLGQNSLLHLGKPLEILKAAGLTESEITLPATVLEKKLKQHGLTTDDLKGLAEAVQRPIMVYEWGSKAKSIVIITDLTRSNGEKITVAVKAERNGRAIEVNDVSSVYGKEAERFLDEMQNAKEGGLSEALRYVDKEKNLDWLGLATPKAASSQVSQGFDIANIIQNFQNPKIDEGFLRMQALSGNEDTEKPIRFLRTADGGEIYGFSDLNNGKIYIDPDLINANTPIHELGHLWNKLIRDNHPRLWAKMVEIAKKSDRWNEVKNDPAYANLKTDDDIADEVLSTAYGDNGEKMYHTGKIEGLNQAKGVFNQVWDWLRGVFGLPKNYDIQNSPLENIAQEAVKLMTSGQSLNTDQSSQAFNFSPPQEGSGVVSQEDAEEISKEDAERVSNFIKNLNNITPQRRANAIRDWNNYKKTGKIPEGSTLAKLLGKETVAELTSGETLRFQAQKIQADKVSGFIKDVLDGKIKNGKQFIDIPEQANRLAEKALGHKINSHRIKAEEVRHIWNKHGLNGTENTANSIPLHKEDIALMPYIMAAPDSVERGNPKNNKKSVKYYKELSNGYVVVVEREVAPDNGNVENVTMWAEKNRLANATSDNLKGSSVGTSETHISQNDIAKIRQDFDTAMGKMQNSSNVRLQAVYNKIDQAVETKNAQDKIQKLLSADKDTSTRKYEVLFEVGNDIADKIKKLTGIDVTGYKYSVDKSEINHTINRHSNKKIEDSRGQIPLKKEDLLKIPEIIKFPDEIKSIGKDKMNRETIEFSKSFDDGNIIVYDAVLTKKKELAFQSMFKKKFSEFMQNSPTPTSEATSEFQDKDTNNSSTNQNLRLQKSQTSITPENAQEMQRIKDQVQANGSFMKAPNGKPTRLNERQWLQVRTDKFKKWFGDWELAHTYDYLLSGEYTSKLTGNEFQKDNVPLTDKVTQFYLDKYNGQVERTGLGVVELSKEGVKDSLAHGIGKTKSAAFAAVPEIIKSGRIIDHQTNWKGRGKDTYVIAAPVKIGNEGYVGLVIITQTTEKNKFYLHEVVIQKSLRDVAFQDPLRRRNDNIEGNLPAGTQSVGADILQGDIAKVIKNIISAKENSSKVVDENGEPLEVAHSTDKKFTAFKNKQENDSGWLGAGYYFFGDRSLDNQSRLRNRHYNSIKIKKGFNPNELHSAFVSEIDIYENSANSIPVNSQIINRATTEAQASVISDIKLQKFFQSAKLAQENFSKVLDENGEPLE